MIVIIDYGMGNLSSIYNMIKKIGASVKVSSDVDDIANATKLILPGVGAFDNGMSNLARMGILPHITDLVLVQKKPLLGICLGMQLLTHRSEEGILPGLGWIPGYTKRFAFAKNGLKVPHMGWNAVMFRPGCQFEGGYVREPRFYFVHSYHVVCDSEENVIGKTMYGYEFASSIQRENIFGVQFHPEKSHKFGLNLLKKFIETA